jgi:MFS family permease
VQGIGGGPYVAEICHPRNRPQCTALINTCWYIGSIIAAWVTFGALNITGSWSWRLCCLVQIVPCIVQIALMLFTEESPRWLISKGREEKALQVLAKFHANGDVNDELVQFEYQEIREAIALEKSIKGSSNLSMFVKTKGNRHRLLIIIVSPAHLAGFLTVPVSR